MFPTPWLLKAGLGLGALALASFVLLTGLVTQVAGAASVGQPASCPTAPMSTASSASAASTAQAYLKTGTPAPTPANTTACDPGSEIGTAVVSWARQMASALYVNPACGNTRGGSCNDTWYTTAFPQPVIQYGQTWCQAHGDCADWANGSYQCVSFVRGAYSQVYPMPDTNDAFGLWATYQQVSGWQEIPAAATTDPAQRGLPVPGDVMIFKDVGVGHAAIVLQVQPPVGQTPGWVSFANANSSSAYDRMPLRPDLTVDTSEWAASGGDYQVWGYLRPKLAAAQRVVRVNQLDQTQYASPAEWQTWAYSACSAAAMTEVLNAYGWHLRIHDVLAVESARGDITPQLGLTHDGGIADTLAHFGLQTTWGEHWSLAQVVDTANAGIPVIVSWPPARYAGGHLVVVTGGDLAAGTITLADSSAWNRHQISVAQFQNWWAGFAAAVTTATPATTVATATTATLAAAPAA